MEYPWPPKLSNCENCEKIKNPISGCYKCIRILQKECLFECDLNDCKNLCPDCKYFLRRASYESTLRQKILKQKRRKYWQEKK